ncbi:MAG: hypothetical protein KGK08_11380, partial [Acidobacteriota bacterium]|nr:hypothetical protein [Acidobacteriota bacterium]
DQYIDLTKWTSMTPEGIARNVKDDNRHLTYDEADTARSAVAEGQAMVTFIDYTLRPAGMTVAHTPQIADKLKDTLGGSSNSPILSRAPLLLQQTLIFPYTEGLSFEAAVLQHADLQTAFAGTLDHPPSSSFEIMHPAAYLAHAHVPALLLPDIHPLIDADYTPYDVGVMGELDVRILTELFGGEDIAKALAPAWDGGYYFAAQKRSATTAEQKASTASIGLLYASHWKNRDSADTFVHVYTGELPRKYDHLTRRTQDEADVTEQVYSTGEGDVLISRSGAAVFISEGFPLELARKLRDAVNSLQAEGPLQVAGQGIAAPSQELSLGFARTLASFGMIRAALPGPYTGSR